MKGILALTLFTLTNLALAAQNYTVKKILEVQISSAITPATLKTLKRAKQNLESRQADLLLIKLNTPGGLVSTTKEIITQVIASSKKPTAVWIGPEGASATSAGAIIASSAHFLFMSPGTNIGAATPVQMGKDIPEDMKAKAVNDLKALVLSLSNLRSRNAEAFSKMITSAESYSAQSSLKQNIIDDIINSPEELLEKLNGRSFVINGDKKTLELQNPIFEKLNESLFEKIFSMLANPSLAYMLFMAALALIYLELQAPGGFIAGSLGALCLLIAAMAFQVLPLNFGSLGLIILGVIFLILEIYITSFGILTILGVSALSFGSLYLFDTQDSFIELSRTTVFSTLFSIFLFTGVIAYLLIKDMRSQKLRTQNYNQSKKGEVIDLLESKEGIYFYQVKTSGEIWKAKSSKELSIGEIVKVQKQEKSLILNIIS